MSMFNPFIEEEIIEEEIIEEEIFYGRPVAGGWYQGYDYGPSLAEVIIEEEILDDFGFDIPF